MRIEITKTMAFSLSDESKERISKILDSARVIAHFGWIPFVLYLGWVQTPNRPPLLALLSPLPSV